MNDYEFNAAFERSEQIALARFTDDLDDGSEEDER